MKTLVFDMDGTIADLYGVETWLEDLQSSNPRPYRNCNPLVNIDDLNIICDMFRMIGYKIIITTWLAKDSTKEFKKETKIAKLEWLEKVGFRYDEIHFLQYGATKANATRKYGRPQILIDDSEPIRKGWSLGETINANEDIFEELFKILKNIVDN